MIGISIKITDGFKRKFSFNFGTKLLTYWELKGFKERHPEFKWMKLRDIPTHALIGYDTGKTGQKYIFESSVRQRLYPYYKSKYEFYFKDPIDVEIFLEIVRESISTWYAVFQLYYFIKTAIWMTFVPKWYLKFWSNKVHGGKSIRQWGNPFPASKICTEQAYMYSSKMDKRYDYPSLRKYLNKVNVNNPSPIFMFDILLSAKEVNLK